MKARVDSVIDSVADRGECDLVRDVALWLPLHAIADLVGVPEEDRKQVFEWTELTFGFDADTTAEERGEAAQAMYAYADAMCAERADDPRDDLMSVLLHAEIDGDRLDQMQLAVFFMLLQNAGSETTRNLITTGMLTLLERPDDLARLQGDLSILPVAIEELLRLATPVMSFTRRPPRTPRSAVRPSPRATTCSWSTRRPTATSAPSTTPTVSTSRVTPTTTSRSAPAVRTSASARTSLGSRASSCSRRSSPASRAWSWRPIPRRCPA